MEIDKLQNIEIPDELMYEISRTDGNNSDVNSRRRLDEEISDEELLRQMIQRGIRNEIQTLIQKINMLQGEITIMKRKLSN